MQTVKFYLRENGILRATATELRDMCVNYSLLPETYFGGSVTFARALRKLLPQLAKNDNIQCKLPDPNGGVSGRIYTFYRVAD